MLILLFACSGAAGLVYQVLWVRGFGRVFGHGVHSAALVTGVFMLGLGVGGYLFGRWIDRRAGAQPDAAAALALRAYAGCEVGIALLAAGIGVALDLAEPWAAAWSTYGVGEHGWRYVTAGSYALRYGIAIAVLAPVTVLMGGTLTLLVRYVVRADLGAAGQRIGLLYGANTVGAAGGALLADAALVPALGASGAQAVAVAVNLGVALVAFRAAGPPGAPVAPAAPRRSTPRTGRVWAVIAILALTGFVGMGLEMVWFRYLSMVLGALRAVFSGLLAVVLVSMGLGAALAGRIERRTGRPGLLLAISQALAVTLAAGLLAAIEAPALASALVPVGAHAVNLGPIVALTAAPALCLGAAYPLANALVQDEPGAVGERAGLLYLGNTVGAIAGSFVIGFGTIPHLGTPVTVTVLVAAAAAACLGLAAFAAPRGAVAATGAALIGVAALWHAQPDDWLLRAGIPPRVRDHRLLALHEGVHELLAVTEAPSGYRRLNTNGHAMSDTDLMNQRYMRAFSHLPLLQLEAPEDVLVICFGVGSTVHAASLHPSVRRIDVVDISKDVLEHAGYFSANHGDVLDDPRVRVHVNDGRLHLRMVEAETYDLITMEPPPLLHAGVASLYSREYYALAKSRLAPGGFVTQWLPAYQVPAETNLAIVRAFVEVFEGAVLLSGKGPELILIGRREAPNRISPEALARRLAARPEVRADLARVHLETPTEIVGTFVGGPDALAAATQDALPITDDRPSMEYAATSQFVLHSQIPEALVDVSGIDAWCPTCFEGGDPHPRTPRLDEYLAIMRAYYGSPAFWERRTTGPATDRRVPRPDGISAEVIRDNSYLSEYFDLSAGP